MASAYKVLVVDDEADLRELLVEELGFAGFECQSASNGKVALEILSQSIQSQSTAGFDLVLSDISMPEMSGLELLAKSRNQGIETPFVFLTAYGDKEQFQSASRLGAYGFLEKPYSYDELIHVLTGAARHGAELRDLRGKKTR